MTIKLAQFPQPPEYQASTYWLKLARDDPINLHYRYLTTCLFKSYHFKLEINIIDICETNLLFLIHLELINPYSAEFIFET